MRVLHVTPYAPPAYDFGGPVRVIETLVAGTLAAGHDVTVATTDALDRQRRVGADAPAVPAGAEVVRFPNRHHALAARAMVWTPRGFLPWARAHVPAFDVVHLHDVFSVLSVGAARAATAASVPVFLQPHGSASTDPARGRSVAKTAFLRAWGRRTLREAAAVLTMTEHERDAALAVGGPATRVVDLPPPLALEAPPPTSPAPHPTVVFLGRLDPIKRVDLLLDAVAVARRRLPDLRLVVIGSGPEEGTLRARAAGLGLDVEWTGFLDGEEKARRLAEAHVLALLSRSEGLPGAALEALACGTPVVLSAGCHLPEADGVVGMEVEAEPAAVADALVAIAADPGRRAALAAGAAAFVRRFDPDVVVGRLLELYAVAASPRQSAVT